MTTTESKPQFPADVWRTASDMPLDDTGDMDHDISVAIARGIMAERERCASLADGLTKASTPGMPLFGAGMCNAADQIASAIRNPPPPNGDVRG